MGEKKPMSKGMKIVMIFMIAGGIIQSAVNIGLTSTAYYSLSGTITASQDIIDSWQQYSFSSVSASATECSGDYAIAYNYTWPGISAGCWCNPDTVTSSEKDKYNVTCSPFCSGSCSSDEKYIGCSDVSSIASASFQKYVVDTTTPSYKYLCLQRTKERYPDTELPDEGVCPDGYTKCGGPTAKNVYCTKLATCPINKLTVTSTACLSSESTTCMQLFTSSSSSDYLRWDNTADALPISELRLNEGGMCTDEETNTITNGRKEHYLYAGSSRDSVCAGYYPRWDKLDTLSEKNLLTSAGVYTSLQSLDTSTGNSYWSGTDPELINWNLYQRSYVPWSNNCSVWFQPLFNSKDDYEQLQTSELALFIVSCISGAFIGLILPAMLIMNLCGKDLPCIKGEGDEEYKRIKLYKRVINYFFKIGLQLPFQAWALAVIARNMAFFKFVAENDCSSALVNADLADLKTQITKSYNSNITSISILCATLVMDLLLQCWHERSEKKKKAAQVASDRNVKPATVSENMPVVQSFEQQPLNQTPQQTMPYQAIPQQSTPQANIVITINPNQLGGQPQGMPQQQGAFQNSKNTGNPFA